MTALSNYAENKVLDHILGTASFTMPTQDYVALYTSNPTDADAGVEVSGSGYARQAADFAAAASGASSNATDLEFTAVGGNWGTITHWGIRDALTSGNLLIHGAFSSSRVINDGDTLLIATGDLDITADEPMAQTIPFAGGDEIVVPFFISSDEGVLDVTSGTIRAEVWWRGRVHMQLTVGHGIEMVSSNPAEGLPHGYIRISETESELLPHGRSTFYRIVYVDPAGVTVSTDEDYLERRF